MQGYYFPVDYYFVDVNKIVKTGLDVEKEIGNIHLS